HRRQPVRGEIVDPERRQAPRDVRGELVKRRMWVVVGVRIPSLTESIGGERPWRALPGGMEPALFSFWRQEVEGVVPREAVIADRERGAEPQRDEQARLRRDRPRFHGAYP